LYDLVIIGIEVDFYDEEHELVVFVVGALFHLMRDCLMHVVCKKKRYFGIVWWGLSRDN
jgi:hypothetical protein